MERPWVLGLTLALAVIGALSAVIHAVLSKRDVRAAIGWAGVALILPILGPLAYLLFGVNRIRRRADRIFGESRARSRAKWAFSTSQPVQPGAPTFGGAGMRPYLDGLVDRRLLDGNSVRPLTSGDEAYRRMLAALDDAERTIALSTYIFDHDAAGLEFADSLTAAKERGVEVRVLIDAVGDRYSLKSMTKELRRRGVITTVFNRNRVPWRFPYFNLRNHRKILVVDGRRAFTGGMNIRQGHRADDQEPGAIHDTHFEVTGPVVADLLTVFAEDWYFAYREELDGEEWFPPLAVTDDVRCRVIEDGPDRNLDKLLWTVLGVLACAERRVKIVNPYFVPDSGLDRALQVAARRGIEVDILVPEHNNLLLVHRASRAGWRWVLEGGCRIWLTRAPFDHSKLMIMDDDWSMVGSSNLDPRSLRLNFEVNMECRSETLNREIDALIERKKTLGREITLEDWWEQPLSQRALDGCIRLLTPYL